MAIAGTLLLSVSMMGSKSRKMALASAWHANDEDKASHAMPSERSCDEESPNESGWDFMGWKGLSRSDARMT